MSLTQSIPNADSPASDVTRSDAKDFMMKEFLMNTKLKNEKSLFQHLTDCIKKVMEERPENATDVFEEVSRRVQNEEPDVKPAKDIMIDVGIAQIEKELFFRAEGEDEEALPEDDIESPLPPLNLMTFFFEQAGVGLSRLETYRVWMALKKLVNTQPVDKARFWGKIFGLEQNYYIAEVELREGEELEDEAEMGAEDNQQQDAADDMDDMDDRDDEEEEEEKLPKSNWKPPPTVPKEEFRTGTNKKLYFVCNNLGGEWIRLPHVTPQQIKAARETTRVFTGRLDATVKSQNNFPGLENVLLRAQIARISAGTQVSPVGYYTFENEEEEAEEGEEMGEPMINEEFAHLTPNEMLDANSWVHHTKHILPQGRCTWWNPSQKGEDEFEEEDDDEDLEEGGGGPAVQPESGPTLLTPLSEDVPVEKLEPWSFRLSSSRVPEYAVALVSSNLWPGAHAFSFQKHFENVYIGWGYKANQTNHIPANIGDPMTEYVGGNEICETLDPTPEEEAAHKAKKGGEEMEEEQEEEEDN